MAVLSSSARDNLPDSAFAYIEPGGKKVNGKTVPGSKRHYPIHDAAHVRNALARIAQGGRFGKEAKGKVMAAASKHGIDTSEHEGASTGRSYDSLLPEVRFISDVPEIRSAAGQDDPHIAGYAASFGKLSRRLGGFVERVMPGAFDETLRAIEGGDPNVNMVCRFNHKDDMLLGTTQAGTLRLLADERGLHYDVMPPRSRADVVELVQRGDVRYSSFAFRCLNPGEDDEWGVTDYGFPMRSLHKVEGLDVAPVTDPAYRDTTAVARNMTGAIESLAMWVDAEPAEVRSMLEAGQAVRFFKRSDRPVPPKSPVPEVRGSEMLDDPAVALRSWKYGEGEPEETRDGGAEGSEPEKREYTEDEFAAHVEESRAMHNHETMCRKWTAGEPCVLGKDHEGECQGRCWGSKDGIPCSMADGHTGAHVPHAYEDGNGPGRGRPRAMRDSGDVEAETEETRTLSGPAALAEVFAMRSRLVSLD